MSFGRLPWYQPLRAISGAARVTSHSQRFLPTFFTQAGSSATLIGIARYMGCPCRQINLKRTIATNVSSSAERQLYSHIANNLRTAFTSILSKELDFIYNIEFYISSKVKNIFSVGILFYSFLFISWQYIYLLSNICYIYNIYCTYVQ